MNICERSDICLTSGLELEYDMHIFTEIFRVYDLCRIFQLYMW